MVQNSIVFNDLDSNEDFELYIERFPAIPRAKRKINYYPIDGRDGSLTEDTNTYEDIEIPISFAIISDEMIYDSISIYDWMKGSGGQLRLSCYPDFLFRVKEVKSFGIEEAVKTLGRFTSVFVCDPFKYYSSGPIVLNQPGNIVNPSTFISKPVIKLYGSGNVTFSINDRSFSINELTDYVIIDGELEDAYKGAGSSLEPWNKKMHGGYPLCDPGNNLITWSGSITKVEIQPNWRWL